VFVAGYSGKPLPVKLDIKPGQRVLLDGAPSPGILEELQPGVTLITRLGAQPFDVGLLFAPNLRRLRLRFERLAADLTTAGALWVAWPKKASGVTTDLTENVVRNHGLDCGLVDVKVCAIDDTWSGLKFVRRLSDRAEQVSDRGE
jgi:hypothetical protein